MQYFKQFIESILVLNEFVYDRIILAYQQSILHNGCFSVTSPYSGLEVKSKGSFFSHTQKIYYLFIENESCFFLMTDEAGFGWPVKYIIFHDKETTFRIDNNNANIVERKDLQDQTRLFLSDFKPQRNVKKIIIFSGDPNFAHHLWNELSAFYFVVKNVHKYRDLNRISLYNLFQPLGNIQHFVNNIKFNQIISDNKSNLRLDEIIGQTDGHATRLGSRLITKKLKERLIRKVSKSIYALPGIHNEERKPFIWLSVRDEMSVRACVNQISFLSALIIKIKQTWENCTIILDGFSLPVDFYYNPMYKTLEELFIKLRESTNSGINKVISHCLGLNPAIKDSIIITDSSSLLSSFFYGLFADYYICHGGTFQHKIGWIHNVPGIMHLPQSTRGHARWYASQSEGSILPELLPDEFITEVEESNTIVRNRNYFIRDIDKTTDWILNKIKAEISF